MTFNINTISLFSTDKSNFQYVQLCKQLLVIKQNTEKAICWHILHMHIP